MAELTIKSKILFRHDTAANWSTKNPILKTGEPGWDSSNKRLKIGNNTLAWSNLEWAFPDPQRYKDTELILGSDMYSGIGRIATNGYNLELAAFGFDFQLDTAALHIGEYGDFYSESNSSLGIEMYPWDKVYTNRIFGSSTLWFGIGGSDYLALEELSNSESIFSLKPYQSQAGDLGTITNPWENLYISNIAKRGTNSPLKIINSSGSTIHIGSSYGESSSDMFNLYSGICIQSALNSSNISPSLYPYSWSSMVNSFLGTTDHPWGEVHIGISSSSQMTLKYNSTEEAIEFLV